MTGTSTDPKPRILAAAMTCFAAKGYSATTMADIEAAAGFVPRTGGTYRHFRSKRAILEAAVEAELTRNEQNLASEPPTPEGSVREGLAELDRQRDLMRVLFRDLDEFPELLARVVERLIVAPYRLVAERTRAAAPGVDAEALAAVFLGAVVNFKVLEHLLGVRPAGVDEDRFVAVWSELFLRAIDGSSR